MNRVTPQTPLSEIADLMNRDGYVLMENALDAAQLSQLSLPATKRGVSL